jgi:hypothetical protein
MANKEDAGPKAEDSPERLPPSWGGPLNESDYETLASSWISAEIANEAFLRRVNDAEGHEVIGQKGNRDCSAILIPYYWPGEPRPHTYRLRRDNPEWTVGRDGKPKPEKKYLGPPKSANRLYIPPGVTLAQLHDVTIPFCITEGEKKSLALWRLAQHNLRSLRFLPVALPGVWNWRGTVGKTNGPNGERLDVKGPITDLGRIEWKNRKVFIAFDTNVRTNDSVNWARKWFARHLASCGAEVWFVNLPEDCGVNGIDDLLASWGPDQVLELFNNSVSGARLEVILPPQFQSRPEGMFRVIAKGEESTQVQLTNYKAAVITSVRLDDGVETKCEFEVEAELLGRNSRFTIPASEFACMDWAIERLGPAAITFPNQREYARAAIQFFSIAAEERSIYTHTGWRNADGQWLFLHAGGGIGRDGVVAGVKVRLFGAMSRYELRLPATPEGLVVAVRASLNLTELAPAETSFPMLAATYRAVLGNSDFALHLAGATGVFKTELAALLQQHFGAAMDRLNLPGAWSSTANALETAAFSAKDVLFVVDDFAPGGSSVDVARYHGAADRLFRAAGNHAGRTRLDSGARLREAKPPRSLILSTGEDIPRGQSVRARALILELSKHTVDVTALTKCQDDARNGFYAEATGGFVQWLASRYEEKQAWLANKVTEFRQRALSNFGHARTPEIVANLQAGFGLFLEFSEECGAIDRRRKNDLAGRCWEALLNAAAQQGKHQAEAEPAAKFLVLLRSLLAAGRVHLEAREGGEPERSPESCGWRMDNCGKRVPRGDCVGWADGDDVYLEPDAAFRAVQVAGRDVGQILPVSEQILKKRLREKGFLASVDKSRETLTVRRTICGSSKNVLHFLRNTILPEVSDADEDAE